MEEHSNDSLVDQSQGSYHNFIEEVRLKGRSDTAIDQGDLKDPVTGILKDISIADKQRLLFLEQERNNQNTLRERIHRQFRVVGDNFYFKDQPDTVAFKDKGERIVSASNEDRVAQAMVTMAEAKNWKTLKVSGHPDFRRKIWREASLCGIDVHGYKPTEQELKQLEEKRAPILQNTLISASDLVHQNHRNVTAETIVQPSVNRTQEQDSTNFNNSKSNSVHLNFENENKSSSVETTSKAASRTYTGRILERGLENFKRDKNEDLSYFVTLATDKGEKTIWGIDLKRALSESRVREGDTVTLEFMGSRPVTIKVPVKDEKGFPLKDEEGRLEWEKIEVKRNTWEVSKSDKAQVVEAVASTLIDSAVKNPEHREVLRDAVNAHLTEQDKTNKVPSILLYDKDAPATLPSQERTNPVIERDAERTR